ncbi:C-terminal processing protease CtpA/Prc [Flavobacterium circumlabens]|uniref:C-terminal processing protease CtpA/Prc n=2 Tax=Flavobacterium circumlabens TaxID=2133765 RepID=A0ABY2AVY7_9FLAO|nr:C-terminal processing protease CtpA/Prc [Flavobacterium circumlabens]
MNAAVSMKKYHFIFKGLLFILFSLAVSCQSEDEPIVYKEGSTEYVNSWMYEQMKKYYLWSENISDRTNLSLDSKEYFKKLLQADDRFSYATQASSPDTFPKSIRSSYGFDMAVIEYEGKVYGMVLFVLSDSPAERNGMKRGQLIKAINGTLFNSQNFEKLYVDLAHSDQAKIQLTEYAAQTGFSAVKEIELGRGFTFSQPMIHKVILNNTEKTGYLAIPHFDIGLASPLLQVFQDFKNQSVTKVIIDLRYNGGGDVSSAAALSIILAPDIKPNDLFIKFKGNKNGGLVNKSFKEALEMNEPTVSYEALRAAHPAIEEVYVLCGSHTASASEIIINNLKPFMKVISIGEKTTGKDVAGFAIEDNRISGQQGWTLYPVIYKLANASDEGNYSNGITPSVVLNEIQNLEIFPLGDTRETLMNRALNGVSAAKQSTFSSVKVIPLKTIQNDTDHFLEVNFK